MKILHVITDLNTGGAEKLLVDLLPRLDEKALQVELCLFNGVTTPFLESLTNMGIKIHKLGTKSDYYNPKHILQLIKLARRFDVVHTHNTTPQLFGAIASIFCKKLWVTTEHTTTSHRRVWWYRPIERWMYRRYTRIICISDAAANAVRSISGTQLSNIGIISNGVDILKYKCAQPIDRTQIGRPIHNKKIILMVGRYSYQKDQATIIKALKSLPNEIELWLVGYGETENTLRTLAHDLKVVDRVMFLGMRTDVPELLKTADIVIQSSHIEGFGLAAVEAMAAGIPVLASDIPGLHDVVDGAGLLFEHENDRQLANHISNLFENQTLYNELAYKGLKRAAEYSIDQMAENYTMVYNQCIHPTIN